MKIEATNRWLNKLEKDPAITYKKIAFNGFKIWKINIFEGVDPWNFTNYTNEDIHGFFLRRLRACQESISNSYIDHALITESQYNFLKNQNLLEEEAI
jgi:hypothetical protein